MILWLTTALAGPCDEIAPALTDALAALSDLEVAVAEARRADAEQAMLACDRVADRALLGRLWLVEGVLRFLEDDMASADQAFAASTRAADDAWIDEFGPKVEARYDLARRAARWPSTIRLTPELGGNAAWFNGQSGQAEAELPAGLHLIQVADPDGAVKFAQVVLLAPALTLEIDTGVATAPLPEPEPIVEPPPPLPPRPKRQIEPLPLIAGGAAALGAGFVAFSAERAASMGKADTGVGLRSSYRASLGAAGGGAALLGLSAVGFGLHFSR